MARQHPRPPGRRSLASHCHRRQIFRELLDIGLVGLLNEGTGDSASTFWVEAVRERAHEKGRQYQRATKRWLLSCPLFGYDTREYGDAYDLTCGATEIGGQSFDFSLTLLEGSEVQRILYAECKYRNEQSGRTNTEFPAYLCSAYEALKNADADAAPKADFVFLTNVPPDCWRTFLHDRHGFLTESLKKTSDSTVDAKVVASVCSQAHVLVLSEQVIGGVA